MAGRGTRKLGQQDPLVGQQIAGRYTLVERIGGGGAGLVYRARHELLGKQVALKLLRPELLDDRARERFGREAQATARLEDPRIVRVSDHGVTDDGRAFIVMELLSGPSLRALLEQARASEGCAGGLGVERATALTIEILAGLEAAHRAGIVHRDLKPENVVAISGEDGDERVKLVDFGLAKVIGTVSWSDAGGLTTTGVMLGTPHYMAPELADGTLGEVGPASDLYAVGVMLYELLTGSRPFAAKNPLALLALHASQPPEPPSRRRPDLDIPPALEAAVLRALAKRPADRFASAAEMRRALTGRPAEPAVTRRLRSPLLLLAGLALLGGAVTLGLRLRAAVRYEPSGPVTDGRPAPPRDAGPDKAQPEHADLATDGTQDSGDPDGPAAGRGASRPPRRPAAGRVPPPAKRRRRATPRVRGRLGLEPNPYRAPVPATKKTKK